MSKKEIDYDRRKARELFEKWVQYDMTGRPQPDLDEEFVKSSLSYSALRMKQADFNLKVKVPSMLAVIFCHLTEDNPGKTVMLFKDLLQSIHDKKHPLGIPLGYKITAEDFLYAFGMSFPVFIDPEVDKRYEKRWRSEKRERKAPEMSDNSCDYAPYWEGLMVKC